MVRFRAVLHSLQGRAKSAICKNAIPALERVSAVKPSASTSLSIAGKIVAQGRNAFCPAPLQLGISLPKNSLVYTHILRCAATPPSSPPPPKDEISTSVIERIDSIVEGRNKEGQKAGWTDVCNSLTDFKGAVTDVEKAYLAERIAFANMSEAKANVADIDTKLASIEAKLEQAPEDPLLRERYNKLSDQHVAAMNILLEREKAYNAKQKAYDEAVKASVSTVRFPPADRIVVDAIDEYNAVAKRKEFKERGNAILELGRKAIADNRSFLSFIAPSGTGKTQLACAIPGGLRLVPVQIGPSSQLINTAAAKLFSDFVSLYKVDERDYKLGTPSMFGVRGLHQNFLSVGLLCWMLDKTKDCATAGEAMKLLCELDETVQIEAKPISALAQYKSSRMLIFDEFNVKDKKRMEALRFCRNVCRVAGVPVAIMSTDSSAANLVTIFEESREGAPLPWSYLVTRMLHFVPSDAQRQVIDRCCNIPSLRDAGSYTKTNPLLATWALEAVDCYIKEHGIRDNIPSDQESKLLQSIRKYMVEKVIQRKRSVYKREGLVGQFALMMDSFLTSIVASELVNKHFAFLSPAGKAQAREHGGIRYWRLGIDSEELSFIDTKVPRSVLLFSEVQSMFDREDKFLQLACSGSGDGEYPIFRSDAKNRMTTLSVFLKVKGRLRLTTAGSNQGAAAQQNDGFLLENLVHVAAIAASRDQEIGSEMSVDDYLSRLHTELSHSASNIPIGWSGPAPSTLCTSAAPTIRFSMSNLIEHKHLENVVDIVERTKNMQQTDIIIKDAKKKVVEKDVTGVKGYEEVDVKKIFIEMKNYNVPVGKGTVDSSIKNLKVKHSEVKFGVLVAPKLQGTYPNSSDDTNVVFVKGTGEKKYLQNALPPEKSPVEGEEAIPIPLDEKDILFSLIAVPAADALNVRQEPAEV